METQAAGPGAFARFDLSRVPSPCFVVDEAAVRRNLAILQDVGRRGGARVLLALKAFSMWALADLVGEHLDGTCASGLWEARLAREHYRGHLTTYCPAYRADDLAEILRLSDTVIFNSPHQLARFGQVIAAARETGETFDIGLRLNPEQSEAEVARYDPCCAGSRLGFPVSQLRPEHLAGVDGLHIHVLCEQGFEPLRRIWEGLEPRLDGALARMKWLNLGGGHHITRADYQREALIALLREISATHDVEVILEPGEAIALDAGILVGEILDSFDNGSRRPTGRRCWARVKPGPWSGSAGPPAWRETSSATTASTRPRLREPASPSSTRPTIRWSRPPPSTACRCRRSRCGTATPTPCGWSGGSTTATSATACPDGGGGRDPAAGGAVRLGSVERLEAGPPSAFDRLRMRATEVAWDEG
jgi:carboxynorspermidine decarboxylase